MTTFQVTELSLTEHKMLVYSMEGLKTMHWEEVFNYRLRWGKRQAQIILSSFETAQPKL